MTSNDKRSACLAFLRNPRTWVLLILLSIAAGGGAAAWQVGAQRGITREGAWLLEASAQREDFYRRWCRGGAKGVIEREAVTQAFAPHGGLPPLMPAWVATAKGLGAKKHAAHLALQANALLFACLILLIGLMGLEAGGALGAIVAALGAATLPRLLGIASMVGFSTSAVFFTTLAIFLLHRSRLSTVAGLGAVLALAAALQSSLIGLFAWLPWLYTSVVGTSLPQRGNGLAQTPPVALRFLWIVPAGLALGFAAYPYLWFETKQAANIWLTHFLRQPADPFAYAGTLWGQARMPWHAAPYLVFATLPPVYLLLACVGWRGGAIYHWIARKRPLTWLMRLPFAPREDSGHPLTLLEPTKAREALLRLAKVSLVLALLLPLLLRTPYFGGIDLIAFALPWLLVFAAAGTGRLVAVAMDLVPWRPSPTRWLALGQAVLITAFLLLIVLPPLFEARRYQPYFEAYYSWFVGGPQGARDRGLPRYPYAPMPSEVLTLSRPATTADLNAEFRVAKLLNDKRPDALRLAVAARLFPTWIKESVVFDAEIIILPHDDLDPAYEERANTFYRSVASGWDMIIYERGGVPLFTVATRAQ